MGIRLRIVLTIGAIIGALSGAFWLLLSLGVASMILADPVRQDGDDWRVILGLMFTEGIVPTSFGIISLLMSGWLMVGIAMNKTDKPTR